MEPPIRLAAVALSSPPWAKDRPRAVAAEEQEVVDLEDFKVLHQAQILLSTPPHLRRPDRLRLDLVPHRTSVEPVSRHHPIPIQRVRHTMDQDLVQVVPSVPHRSLAGRTVLALRLAVDFTLLCIQVTCRDENAPWYGVEFEKALRYLPELLER